MNAITENGFVLRFRRTGSRPFGLSRRHLARCGGDPQGANEATLVTGIALDHICSRGVQGAGLRANLGNDYDPGGGQFA